MTKANLKPDSTPKIQPSTILPKHKMTETNFKADPSDSIIVVMGPTGSGKSNFINALTRNKEAPSARNLVSDTQSVIPHIIFRHNRRLVLVDTPGFDDTYRSDTETLRVMADWFTQKYPSGETLRVAGVIYLHRITDQRMMGSVYNNLQMFGRLCGNMPLRRVRLVTTMWDTERDQVAANKRENDLKGCFWDKFLAEGAVTERFQNTRDSAWNIVEDLLAMGNGGEKLLLQEELVEQKKNLNETAAAKLLSSRFQQLLVEQRKTLKELAGEVKAQNDPTLARILQEEHDKINAEFQNTLKEVGEMKIPLARHVSLWFKPRYRAQPIKLDQEI